MSGWLTGLPVRAWPGSPATSAGLTGPAGQSCRLGRRGQQMFEMNGNQAVVLGASMAGLLAARVLSERFERVVVIERDVLPPAGEHRRGVPQGRHLHGLHPRGREILEELFPGFTASLRVARRGMARALAAVLGTVVEPSYGGVSRRTVADHAAISARRPAPSLVRMCVMCAEMVLGASTRCSAICRLVRPAATSWATWYSRSLSGCHGSAGRPGSNERVSRSASSRKVVAPAVLAIVRVSSRSRAASDRRRARAAAAARSSRADVPSQNRRRARHASLADYSAWCAAGISPRASRISPSPWPIARSVPGIARAVSTAPTRASHFSAASTSPRARCARTPVSR